MGSKKKGNSHEVVDGRGCGGISGGSSSEYSTVCGIHEHPTCCCFCILHGGSDAQSVDYLVSVDTVLPAHESLSFPVCLSVLCIRMGLNKLVLFLCESQSPVSCLLWRCTLIWGSGRGLSEELRRSLLFCWEVIMQLVNLESTL